MFGLLGRPVAAQAPKIDEMHATKKSRDLSLKSDSGGHTCGYVLALEPWTLTACHWPTPSRLTEAEVFIVETTSDL